MVQWKETCVVRYRDCLHSDQDIQESWYSIDEIAVFKEERKQIKLLAKQFSSLELYETTLGNVHSSHGLEKYICRSKASQRKERIRECLETVCSLQEQAAAVATKYHHRQEATTTTITTTTSAELMIAQVYRKMTASARREAIARALFYMAQGQEEQLEQPSEYDLCAASKSCWTTTTTTTNGSCSVVAQPDKKKNGVQERQDTTSSSSGASGSAGRGIKNKKMKKKTTTAGTTSVSSLLAGSSTAFSSGRVVLVVAKNKKNKERF